MSKKEMHKEITIEKYDMDDWEKEKKPYAMILTDVIQRIPPDRMREAFLWIYLESLPQTWVPNKHHLTQHFDISDRTYERWMSWLNTVKLIEYRQNRNGGGSFGKGKLIVLSGSRFSPEAECCGTVKIGGTAINKKKAKVIHISEGNRDAKNGGSVKTSTTRAKPEVPSISPNRQKTVPRSDDAHINTTKSITKERKKTNNPVSVFSDTESVKTHLNLIIANRSAYVEDDIIDQGIYYAYETNSDKSFDAVNKRLNIFLKKVREGKWLIPQNYKGISSQSIREKEEREQAAKQEQYRQEAAAFQAITQTTSQGQGLKAFSSLVQKLKDDLNGKNVDGGAMQKQTL